MNLAYILETALAGLVLGVAAWTILARNAFAASVGYVSYGLLLVWLLVLLASATVGQLIGRVARRAGPPA
ncbi:MAG: hypothetical protein R6V62_04365 [Candidatus Fermentibacteraceae bacterium]